jgi:hypothetical protein
VDIPGCSRSLEARSDAGRQHGFLIALPRPVSGQAHRDWVETGTFAIPATASVCALLAARDRKGTFTDSPHLRAQIAHVPQIVVTMPVFHLGTIGA